MKNTLIKRRSFVAITLVISALCILAGACQHGQEFGGIVDKDITALIPAPVRGASRLRKIDDQPQFTGSISWVMRDNGEPFNGARFAAETGYTAIVTLTARSGYNFSTVTANSFTHRHAVAVSNPAGDADSMDLRIIISFSKTASATDLTVNQLDMSDLIEPPVKYGIPQAVIPPQPQYNAYIEWQTADGSPFTGAAFAPGMVYRAVLGLIAVPGYTLTDLSPDSFVYPGAAVIFDPIDGVLVITFPNIDE